MKIKSKLALFIIILAIAWALLFIAFGFVLNEYNPVIWEQGYRTGLVLTYLFSAAMTALGVYGD